MRKLLFLFLLLPLMALSQDRVISIVFDDSGSMKEDGRFIGANYSLQMLIGLMNPADELHLVTMSDTAVYTVNLMKKTAMNKEIRSWSAGGGTPFRSVEKAMEMVQQSNLEDKWLVIVTDGDFEELHPDYKDYKLNGQKIKDFVEETGSQVLILNINKNQSTTLTYLFEEYGMADIFVTPSDKQRVIEEMNKVASTVMSMPPEGLTVEVKGQKASVQTTLPLKRLIVVEQAAGGGALLNIEKAKIGKTELSMQGPFDAEFQSLKGRVSHLINGEEIIPEGFLSIEFDGEVDINKFKFLPEVAAYLSAKPIANFKNIEGNVYVICDEQTSVKVQAEVLTYDGKPVSYEARKHIKVLIRTGDKEYVLDNPANETFFTGRLPIGKDRTAFAVEAHYDGYFDFRSNVFIIETDTCPRFDFGADIRVVSPPVKITEFPDWEGAKVKPVIYLGDVNVTEKEYEDLYLDPLEKGHYKLKLEKDGEHFVLKPRLKWWCPTCFLKAGTDSTVYELKSEAREIIDAPKAIVILNIEDVSFWEKCGSFLLFVLLTLLLLIYLFGILKKKRFSSGGLIIYQRVTEYIPSRERTEELKTGFFNRYLVPFISEKKTIHGVTFVAGDDGSYITLPMKHQKENMYIQNNKIEKPGKLDRHLFSGGKLEIRRKSRTDEYTYQKK